MSDAQTYLARIKKSQRKIVIYQKNNYLEL